MIPEIDNWAQIQAGANTSISSGQAEVQRAAGMLYQMRNNAESLLRPTRNSSNMRSLGPLPDIPHMIVVIHKNEEEGRRVSNAPSTVALTWCGESRPVCEFGLKDEQFRLDFSTLSIF